MGDGQVASHDLRLCTDSYQITEIVKLINVLIIKYIINCSIHVLGGNTIIYISAKSVSLLSSIVKPLMSKDMLYMLELGKNNVQKNNSNQASLIGQNKVKKFSLSEYNYTQKRTISTLSTKKGIFIKNAFGSYLAGYFEGDGHIWIQKPSEKKKHNPRFCITFSMKNEPLAKKILEIIGSGFIRYKLQDNACVLVVSPVIGLKKIVNLLNGELRTPKVYQMYKLID